MRKEKNQTIEENKMKNLENEINSTPTGLRHNTDQAGYIRPGAIKTGIIALGILGTLVTGYMWKAAPRDAYTEFTAPRKGGVGTLKVVGPKQYGFFEKTETLVEIPAASGLGGSTKDDEFKPNYGPIPDSKDINGTMFLQTKPIQSGKYVTKIGPRVYNIESTLDGNSYTANIIPRPGVAPVEDIRSGLAVGGDADMYNEPGTGGGIVVQNANAMEKLETTIAAMNNQGYARIRLDVHYK